MEPKTAMMVSVPLINPSFVSGGRSDQYGSINIILFGYYLPGPSLQGRIQDFGIRERVAVADPGGGGWGEG